MLTVNNVLCLLDVVSIYSHWGQNTGCHVLSRKCLSFRSTWLNVKRLVEIGYWYCTIHVVDLCVELLLFFFFMCCYREGVLY